MSTITHAAAQAVGWVFGFAAAFLSLLTVPRLLKKAFAKHWPIP